jgi:peptidoglycan/LPS O-acetylase OafA/YrhL
MNDLPSRRPFHWREVTGLELLWSILGSAWISAVLSWRWPFWQIPGHALWGAAAQFILCFAFCSVVAWCFFAANGTVPIKTVESKNIGHISRLNHLRFFAAVLVVLYHFYHSAVPLTARNRNVILNVIGEGSSAVGLFFVLSGFIFGLIGYEKKIRYFDFLWSRIVRIYPLYLFALLIVVASHRTQFTPGDFAILLFPVLDTIILPGLPGFGQLWTVAVEFQFYLIFPFLAAFVVRNGYRYLFGLLLLVIGVRLLYYTELGSTRDISYWTLLGRIDEFVLGIGSAWLFVKKQQFFSHPIHLVFAGAIALAAIQWLVAWGGYYNGANSALWVVWPTIAGAVSGYLLLSYICCRIRLPALLDGSLDKLGALSFSIYVMHSFALDWTIKYAPSLKFTDRVDLNAALVGSLICVPAAVIIAWGTYHMIEKQFFVFRRKYTEPVAART